MSSFHQLERRRSDRRSPVPPRFDLIGAHLERSYLSSAYLDGASLSTAHLESADLGAAHLEGADLSYAHLERADLRAAHLKGADLSAAHLEGAYLQNVHFEGRVLGAEDLTRIRHWSTNFPERLLPTDLRLVFLNEATTLNDVCLGSIQHGHVRTADMRWGGVNLAVIDLPPASLLGDEREARQTKGSDGKPKGRTARLEDYRAAVRANRQLAVALQSIGLNEEAARQLDTVFSSNLTPS